MSRNQLIKINRDVLKMLDLEHLNNDELRLLGERKLDKDTMLWAILHLSECRRCCQLASRLTAEEIKDVLAGTPYGKPDFVEQIINYYFQTINRITH